MIDPSRIDMFKSRRQTCLFGAPVQGIGAAAISDPSTRRRGNNDLKIASGLKTKFQNKLG